MLLIIGCGERSTDEGTNEQLSEQETSSGDNPIVTMTIEDGGEVQIVLYPNIAPNTVNNFISLVEDRYYNGLIFHRVIPGFMIQSGDPEGTGMGEPCYSIKGEFSSNDFENDLQHDGGVLSMARLNDLDLAESQFFIMTDLAPYLDGGYAAFEKVLEGMDVIVEIVSVEQDNVDKAA